LTHTSPTVQPALARCSGIVTHRRGICSGACVRDVMTKCVTKKTLSECGAPLNLRVIGHNVPPVAYYEVSAQSWSILAKAFAARPPCETQHVGLLIATVHGRSLLCSCQEDSWLVHLCVCKESTRWLDSFTSCTCGLATFGSSPPFRAMLYLASAMMLQLLLSFFRQHIPDMQASAA
jgi:hypothetical protein